MSLMVKIVKKSDGLDALYKWLKTKQEDIRLLESIICTKNKYTTKAIAKTVAAVRQKKTGITLRVYLCDKCNHFHLTKSELRKENT